jgi:sulfhydrogenase subunit delta
VTTGLVRSVGLPSAAFRLSGCGGDLLALEAGGEGTAPFLPGIDLVWREDLSPAEALPAAVEVAFVEGAVVSREDERRLREIRDAARILVALGACAARGGPAASRETWGGKVRPAWPLHRVVKVDHHLAGCPVGYSELREFLLGLAHGRGLEGSRHPVCFECRLAGNPCRPSGVGACCLGPVTAGGCGAACPSLGAPCDGCRGPAHLANPAAFAELATRGGYDIEDVTVRLRTTWAPLLPDPRRPEEE